MNFENAKLKARPSITSIHRLDSGVHKLGVGIGIDERGGLLYIPRGARGPLPLLILLHGSGGMASHMLEPFQELADETGTVLLVPESRGQTWDAIVGDYGTDVEMIDRSLEKVFSNVKIDEDKIAIGGFSDGASYALSLGIINGDLFSYVLAFSPGFMAPPLRRDAPPVFISHGIKDPVLNINLSSRRMIPVLSNAGIKVTYHEFTGGHEMPEEMIKEAMTLFLGSQRKVKEGIMRARVHVNQREISRT